MRATTTTSAIVSLSMISGAIAFSADNSAHAQQSTQTTTSAPLSRPEGGDAYRARSVYSSFGQGVFIRGGYVPTTARTNGDVEFSGPIFSAGYRHSLRQIYPGLISLETELVHARLNPNDQNHLTALISLRYDVATTWRVTPFASFGIGPAVYTTNDNFGDAAWALGYSGRAGALTRLNDRFSFELAYRYLGATNSDATATQHTVEGGLNLDF